MENTSKVLLISAAVIGSIVGVLFLANNPFVIVGAGERGIVLNFGAPNGTVMEPGLNFRTPIVQRVVKIDVQTQKDQVEATAASKDLQNVTATIALNYRLDPQHVTSLYQNIGLEYKGRVIDPAVQEAVKSVTARYTAEELVTRRQEAKEEMKATLIERLSKDNIVVDDLSIVNFSFSQSFDAAIEAKVTAEQNALAAKNKLEQVKFEAQQQIETAKAQAESIRIQAEALAKNEELVKLKAVEKWNGVLPQYMMTETVPFVDISR